MDVYNNLHTTLKDQKEKKIKAEWKYKVQNFVSSGHIISASATGGGASWDYLCYVLYWRVAMNPEKKYMVF